MATPDLPTDERRRKLDSDDSDDSDENVLVVERIPQEVKAPSDDAKMSSDKPASGSARKRPASEGFDMLKTLGTSTKKRNTEGHNGHALDRRTKHWKDDPKSSSDNSTDPDGSKNASLRAMHPDVSEQLENLFQLLQLMKLHQETLDAIPPPNTKDKDLKKNTTQKAYWKQLQENRKVLKECVNQLAKSVKALKPFADSSGDVGVVHADLQSYKNFVDKLEKHGDAFEERANALNTKAEEVLNSVSSLQDSSNTFSQLQESSMDASEKAQLSTTKTLDHMGSTISDIQRSLDSLVKIANKNKNSFWGTKDNPDPDNYVKNFTGRPHLGHTSDRHADRKAAMDDKVVRHNFDQKKATERAMTFTGSVYDLALTDAFCGKLNFNTLAKLFPDWDDVLHLFKENRAPSDSQAKELGVNFFKKNSEGRFPFYESYMQHRSSGERSSQSFFMMFYEALQKRDERNSGQRLECECTYTYLGDDNLKDRRQHSRVGMKNNPASLHWNSTTATLTIHPVEHSKFSEYLPNLKRNPLSMYTKTTFERKQTRMFLRNDDFDFPVYKDIDALFFRSAALYMMRTIIDRENFKKASVPGGYEARYKPTYSAAIRGLRQVREAFSWRRIEGYVPELLAQLSVEFVNRFRAAMYADTRTQSQHELHLQCASEGSPSSKAFNGKIVKYVKASPTFDSDEYDGIANLDYGYVQNINRWRAHVIAYLSDEITRILDMGQNQRKLDELYVPARGLRNRAISKIESFIPNFEAVVADASRAK